MLRSPSRQSALLMMIADQPRYQVSLLLVQIQ